MLRLLIVGSICFLSYVVYAQEVNTVMESLYEQEAFLELLDQIPEDKNTLSSESHFYIGMTLYNLAKDSLALPYFINACKLDPVDAEYQFYLGLCAYFLDQDSLSQTAYNAAIALDRENPIYFTAKADGLRLMGELDSALIFYYRAQQLDDCPDRAYFIAADVWREKGELDEAKLAYENALAHIDLFHEEYTNCMYKIALIDYDLEKYEIAIDMLKTLLEYRPLNFPAMSKLIQCYYATGVYTESIYWKKKIYEAYKRNSLPPNMQEMVCFDQFIWNGHRVFAFERFDSPRGKTFYKHIFFLINPDGNVEFSVQTEHSYNNSILDKFYVLSKTGSNGQETFYKHTFDKVFRYNELKTAVIDIFERNLNYAKSDLYKM